MTVAIIIIAIIAIPLIAAAFLSKEFRIEREVVINKPNDQVFDYVKHIKNQHNYSKWVMTDPNAKMQYRGTDGTVGFTMAWDSENKNVGKGEQEVTRINDGKSVDMEIRFEKPFKSTSFADMQTQSLSDNQTQVKWTFIGVRNYPMKVMHFLVNLKKVLENDIDTSLNNLKVILEQ
jgi:uncharacterized membrane protein